MLYKEGTRVRNNGSASETNKGRTAVVLDVRPRNVLLVRVDDSGSTREWLTTSCDVMPEGPHLPGSVVKNFTITPPAPEPVPEHSGGSVAYYVVDIQNPTTKDAKPYRAECNDIIEALGMNYAEGNAFKAVWRKAAARTLGKLKAGNDAKYDAEKIEFFGGRLVAQEKVKK